MLKHHHALRAGARRDAGPAERSTVKQYFAAGEMVEAGDGIEQGALAASGRTDDGDEFAGADFRAAIFERDHCRASRVVNLAGSANGQCALH